jgi:short-subunit dehydrogenase
VFAHALAARGYDLLLVARRRDRLQDLSDTLWSRHECKAEPLEADLTSDAGLQSLAARISAEPRLSLLVNNAGFGTVGLFAHTKVESQCDMHRLHVIATMRLCHAALQQMVQRNQGGIINVSSVAGFGVSPGNVSYCSTKTWMNTFTEGLHIELKAMGSAVKVQALCPGFTTTEFHQSMGVDRNQIPKRLWMDAEKVVETSLRGLESGKLFVIPGLQYKVMVWLMQAMPMKLRHALSTLAGRKFRRL